MLPDPAHPVPVFRFAPSPNGDLHVGHALSAAVGWRMAQASGGRFLVRIEDIDLARSKPEHLAGIFRDLAWLGLDWEQPVLLQSTRFSAYDEAARRLIAAGLLYPCFSSRSEIAAVVANAPNPRDPDGAPLYPVALRRLDEATATVRLARGDPHALRLDLARALSVARDKLGGRPLTFTELSDDGQAATIEARPEVWGDAVIVRKETPASYTLAVVVDDAFQGVTHVTRGRDLYAVTGLQRLLQVVLDLPEPVYHHHRLVLDAGGAKLSKSEGSASIASLRAGGASPNDIWRLAGIDPPSESARSGHGIRTGHDIQS